MQRCSRHVQACPRCSVCSYVCWPTDHRAGNMAAFSLSASERWQECQEVSAVFWHSDVTVCNAWSHISFCHATMQNHAPVVVCQSSICRMTTTDISFFQGLGWIRASAEVFLNHTADKHHSELQCSHNKNRLSFTVLPNSFLWVWTFEIKIQNKRLVDSLNLSSSRLHVWVSHF